MTSGIDIRTPPRRQHVNEISIAEGRQPSNIRERFSSFLTGKVEEIMLNCGR